MPSKTLHVLLLDRDVAHGERLLGTLQRSTPFPLVIELVTELEGVPRDPEHAFQAALLSLSPEEDAGEQAKALAAVLPNVPIITVDGESEFMDLSGFVASGVQDHIPSCCATCRNSRRLVSALRWAVERHRLLNEVEHMQRRSEHLALHDPLTDLANRSLFRDRLRHLLAGARRNESGCAVMFIDLDRFKRINDSLGHAAGDRLLTETAHRLAKCLRASDTIARWGGDEFTVVLDGIRRREEAAGVARKLLETVRRPIAFGSLELSCTASIGISLFPDDGLDEETLIKHADVAMYRAKADGGDGFRCFDRRTSRRALERVKLESTLRRALERGELSLHYQPQIELREGRLVGLEALLRWKDRKRGNVPPDRFIPIAEETGLIVPLGEWALEAAGQQIAAWRAKGLTTVPIAVNFSYRQFQQRGLVRRVREILERCGIGPRDLELELTETTVMTDPPRTEGILRGLAHMGVGVSIDDFGTGASSLEKLSRLPIQRLKIDKGFVERVPGSSKDKSIAGAIIDMARALGMSSMAEGVERIGQLDFLRERGCCEAQGFLIAPPLRAEEVPGFLRMGRWPVTSRGRD